MDEATQKSTQPYADPRRSGFHNSGLNEEDVADILCILHPSSLHAHSAVAATARHASQHILQNDDLELSEQNGDIALRLSSNVKDPTMGFIFGRNLSRCDIVLTADDSDKKVSNAHFRIHLKDDGIVMLEDISTNGTVVDDFRLRKGKDSSRMLTSGSIIQVASSEANAVIKFIVRFPPRDGYEQQYMDNCERYLVKIDTLRGKTKPGQQPTRRAGSRFHGAERSHYGNTHGMHWNGGAKYNVTGQLGRGAFATVYKVATKSDGLLYAAKELDKRRFMKNNVLDAKVDNELRIMKDLRHPNIVQYEEYYEHGHHLYIIMELISGGELSGYLHEVKSIPEESVRSIARQILHALYYLHQRRITHRDIKPDNILIESFDPVRVKLSDFGLSKMVMDQTFLKTFCGTLLYCAPEVYPEYEKYKTGEARKRFRNGEMPPKKFPYDESVDMWSLGAVLFHILCGTPPYLGRGDDRGREMLKNIMTTEADFDLLRQAKVSEVGIDFVSRLLNRDPRSRSNELECFRHPWIAEVADVFDYGDLDDLPIDPNNSELSAIGELEEEEELDASQLSIHDKGEAKGSFEDNIPKRLRLDGEGTTGGEVQYPSLPHIESFPTMPANPVPGADRLFGEIAPTALRSSAALGRGPPDSFASPAFQHREQGISSCDFVFVSSESTNSGEHHSFSSGQLLHFSQSLSSLMRNADPAPSLMGAESLVGQLNMDSAEGGIEGEASAAASHRSTRPGAETPSNPTPPANDAPETRQPSSCDEQGRSGQDTTPKAKKAFKRRIELPPPRPVTASGVKNKATDTDTRSLPPTDNVFSAVTNPQIAVELATIIDERTGEEVPPTDDDLSDGKSASATRTAPNTTPNTPPSEAVLGPGKSLALGPDHFVKPRARLGKLTTLPGSIIDATFWLESRMTSWGRGLRASVPYPDPMDSRIPSYALELTFWAPSIESRIAQGQDWMEVPNVMTILSTKASKCVWVNDVELRSRTPDGDATLFGKLYTGDIITVYSHKGKFLKFQCEFYHGGSAMERPETEAGFFIEATPFSKSPDSSH